LEGVVWRWYPFRDARPPKVADVLIVLDMVDIFVYLREDTPSLLAVKATFFIRH
jgi:hypothetical protein